MDDIYTPLVRESSAGNGHPDDQPRERLARCGVAGLRDDELLAVVLGTGYRGCGVVAVARQILQVHPKEELVAMAPSQLRGLKGVVSL